MRHHCEKTVLYSSMYRMTYSCNHPVYDKCTLFKINSKGLAAIQQRFDQDSKHTYWSEIDPWLVDALYLHTKFGDFFEDIAG